MKVHFIHNGCEANLADSERSKLDLLKTTKSVLSSKEEADCIVFHGCTFTHAKEEETIATIENLLASTDKVVVVSGCYLREYVRNDRVHFIKDQNLGNTNWSAIVPDAKDVNESGTKKLLPLVSISRGCFGSCTFCSIKLAQGTNKSRNIEEILADIDVRKDLEYIKLVGDEVAGFGIEKGLSLKILVEAIVSQFPNIKLKFGSLNCKLLKKYSDKELRIFSLPNVTGNIHIPIQSASNKILKLMSRGYSIEEYVSVYNRLKSFGVANISGDIICGFPEETEEDHHQNLRFIAENKFEFMEVFAYNEREGTKAAQLEQLPILSREKRAVELIVQFISSYSSWHNISVDEITKNQALKIFNTNIKIQGL